MSVSKLESLPNEILAVLLEKYINGIDVINAFAFQLNQRFDALITQSQRLRFDFIRCHKNDFCLSMGLLPAYIDKVEQLALSERYTPGQVHAFLSFHRSFKEFKNLRKLYFHIDGEAVESRMLIAALQSISTTNLHTLSLDITGVDRLYSLHSAIAGIFRMKTLKKLLISCDSLQMDWESLKGISSNIEYLTIRGIACYQADLATLFQCASGLKYLDINVQFVTYHGDYDKKSSSKNLLPQMTKLHTLIFNMVDNDQAMFNQLETYFKLMSSLRHLEIRTQNGIWSITPWEILIKSSLPLLTSFILEETTTNLKDKDISTVLESTATPFWTAKPHFHVIIKQAVSKNKKPFYADISKNPDQYRWDETTARWFIGPQQKLGNDLSVLNSIHKLHLFIRADFLSPNAYLKNVTHLALDALDDQLLKRLTIHVNCSRIKYLDLSPIRTANSIISSLLESANNIKSLRIHPERLYDKSLGDLRHYDNIENLDISADEHQFHEEFIDMISKIFPRLEHLTIYTRDLENVPLLQTYLPRLHSLTFRIIELANTYFYDDHEQQLIDSIIRGKAEFFFRRHQGWLTVWIDQAALQSEYWKMNGSGNNSQGDSDRWLLHEAMEERYYD